MLISVWAFRRYANTLCKLCSAPLRRSGFLSRVKEFLRAREGGSSVSHVTIRLHALAGREEDARAEQTVNVARLTVHLYHTQPQYYSTRVPAAETRHRGWGKVCTRTSFPRHSQRSARDLQHRVVIYYFNTRVCLFFISGFVACWRARMNVFRLAGDVSHLLAIIILFMKIWRSKSCAGNPRAYVARALTRHVTHVKDTQ